MVVVAKIILILFSVFLLVVGLVMLIKPEKARAYLRKAGSTNLINYTEITLRMVPAAALVIYAEFSVFPAALSYLGWFMLATSLILFFIPRTMHHRYALFCADLLNPTRMRLVSPFSMLFGLVMLFAVVG